MNETKPQQRTRRRGLGRLYSRPNGPCLWIEYWHLGRRYRESCGSHLERVAKRMLQKRQSEIARKGRVVGPDVEGVTFRDIEAELLEHHKDKVSAANIPYRIRHLKAAFGNMRAVDIRSGSLKKYVRRRRREGAANDTIRQELKVLHLGFALLVEEEKLESIPAFKPAFDQAPPSPPREGAYTPEETGRILHNLPARCVRWLSRWRSRAGAVST
jgi:hypothetical protein